MSKISNVLNQLLDDIVAVFLSFCSFWLAFGICYFLFGEESSLLSYIATFVITTLGGTFGASVLCKLVAKQHAVPMLILSAVMLLTFIIIMIIVYGRPIEFIIMLFSEPFNAVNGGFLGFIFTGICAIVSLVLLIRDRKTTKS